jgi:hypothetical protein
MDGQSILPGRNQRRLPTDAQSRNKSFLRLLSVQCKPTLTCNFICLQATMHPLISRPSRPGPLKFSIIGQSGLPPYRKNGILWRPWLATHFAHIKSWAEWGGTPALQFTALAFEMCMVCAKPVLRLELRRETTRYAGPHSYDACPQLCCAKHRCQCSCMANCRSCCVKVRRCIRCIGWVHEECDM